MVSKFLTIYTPNDPLLTFKKIKDLHPAKHIQKS
jgi:hypothetical protein